MSDENAVETEEIEVPSVGRMLAILLSLVGGIVAVVLTVAVLIPMLLNYHRPLPEGWTMQYNSETKAYRFVNDKGRRDWTDYGSKWRCTAAAWDDLESTAKYEEQDKHWQEIVPAHVVTNCTVITNASVPKLMLDIGKSVRVEAERVATVQMEVIDQEICDLEKRVTKLELETRSNLFLNLPKLEGVPTKNVQSATNLVVPGGLSNLNIVLPTNWFTREILLSQ